MQQIALQYHSKEEQSYRALLQWKELFQESATHEGLVEFLVRHTSLSTVEAALNIISPANLGKIMYTHIYLARAPAPPMEVNEMCRNSVAFYFVWVNRRGL